MKTAAPPAGRARILVVDDEIGPRESLRMLLKPAHEIRTADGAQAALAEIERFRPDLVILDVKMPQMDGLEVLRRIKRVDPALEVVMITAYASLETVKQALSYGAFEYLIKPFARQDLEDVVARALQRRQTALGARTEVTALVNQMRSLAAKTRELEEAARREAAEQSLRMTQLSILREIGRSIIAQLDLPDITAAVVEQLRRALGYDHVAITFEAGPAPADTDERLVQCAIRDAQGPLGYLVVDNRASGGTIDPRERELLEMLCEYLAIAVRNSRLYSEVASTTRRLEQLIACAGDAIVTVDAADRVQGWNPAAEGIFGIAATEALGSPVIRILPERDYLEGKRRLRRGQPTYVFEASARSGDESPVDVAVTLSALRGRQGEPEGLIAIVRDITAQRKVENQLHQSEKLTALGQLAGGIAHDFNNLLQAILGYAQLMKQNPGDARLVSRSLQVLETAALDGSETVRRIQQFARLRPDEQFVPVDLNQIVQDAVAITRPRWEEKVAHENRPLHLRLDLGPIPPLSGRPSALTELTTNLILNAIDAMPDGGTLTISTRRRIGGGGVLAIADTGVGIPEAVGHRIFEPFFSTKGEGGSGLGLAMVYSIVTRHGGNIHVDSEPGRGATFTLMFPAATPSGRAEVSPPPPGERRPARVLVVDDDPQVLGTFTELLHSFGYVITAVSSGAAALSAYGRDRFDVVLTNLGMAGMNGWEFAERLRAADRDVRLMFVTGWGLREEDYARLEELGVKRCLFKPVQPGELDGAIQAVLAGVGARKTT
jgi:two-component system NtrC family sensor kinase